VQKLSSAKLYVDDSNETVLQKNDFIDMILLLWGACVTCLLAFLLDT